MSAWIAAIIALFVWWFSTGAILMAVRYADMKGARARLRLTILAFPLAIGGALGLHIAASNVTILGVYVGFLSALALWGWIELAFLTGILSGPNTEPLPPGLPEDQRFLRAWNTIAHHEIALLATLAILAAAQWDAPNAFGFWTFALLYFARISAKLNLYLGVPQFQTDFLPDALGHVPSHFRRRDMNWFFPISITGLSFATACWLERLYAADTAARVEGFALLTALTVLALFEHWMMVLPIPDERLWRWMLPRRPLTEPTTQETKTGGHHGL